MSTQLTMLRTDNEPLTFLLGKVSLLGPLANRVDIILGQCSARAGTDQRSVFFKHANLSVQSVRYIKG